jgi:hypothetical protein
MSELHISQAFREHQARPIPTPYEPMANYFFIHGFARRHLQCDQYGLNVKFLIFFKKIYKVHSVEILSQDPCLQKEF